ncbi:MAG: hypothetical protein KBA51_00565 [Kiritimatiellae bacterium]|nr:hypothetical protein [Kiritimatiellia bacterium]
MISGLEHFTFRHPRHSSDFAIRVDVPGTPAAIFMVADMVGRPKRLRWKNFMGAMERQLGASLRREPPTTADELYDHLKKAILASSDVISRLREKYDQEAFGFCLCAACFWDRSARISNLGDCRAYRIGIDTDGHASAQCLTHDRNQLHDFMSNHTSPFVTPERLAELSHRLGSYMGMSERAQVEDALNDPVNIELQPGNCLWLSTDGFHMPVVRAIAGHAQMKLNLDEFYLERWLAAQVTRAREHIPSKEPNFWPEVGEWLLVESLQNAASHKRYRDDIAVVGVYSPLPPELRCTEEKYY